MQMLCFKSWKSVCVVFVVLMYILVYNSVVGLGCKVAIVCEKCKEAGSFNNCKKIGQNSHVYSINRRAVYAMRCIGQGLAGLKVY